METITERDSTIGVIRAVEDEEFTALSNFVVDLKCEVEARPQSGDVCQVTFWKGEVLG